IVKSGNNLPCNEQCVAHSQAPVLCPRMAKYSETTLSKRRTMWHSGPLVHHHPDLLLSWTLRPTSTAASFLSNRARSVRHLVCNLFPQRLAITCTDSSCGENSEMSATVTGIDAAIERVQVAAYHVPTDAPEADGTLSWDHTTLVTAEISGGGHHG